MALDSYINNLIGIGGKSSGGFPGAITSFLGGPWGPVLQGLGGLFGGMQGIKTLEQGRSDILGLPGMDGPMNVGGNFGQSINGQFMMDPTMMGAQSALGGAAPFLLGGGFMGQNANLQSTMNNINFQDIFNQSQGALGQQASPFYNQQGFGQLYNQQQGMNSMLGQQFAAGPQDLTGGLQSGMFNLGLQNMGNATNQQNVYNQQLDVLRQAAAPEINRQQNQLMDKLYSKGLLGNNTTATGEAMRGFQEAVNSQDLGFQNRAFDTAFQQQNLLANLGQSQFGMGQNLMGQNLGFYGDQAQRLLAGIGQQGAMEGQGFQQQMAALGQNQAAGMNRLAQAQGLFGFGGEQFGNMFNLGLGASQGLLGYGDFGLNAAAMPYNLQASLLGASGYHSQALAQQSQALADAQSGFLGGLFG